MSALFVAMFMVLPAWGREFTLAGSIPFADVIDALEWTVPGYDYGDSSIKVWYSPADRCFSSDADAVDLVRQWIQRDVQDHRINGIKLYCQKDRTGTVVVFGDADFENQMPKRLYVYRADGEARDLSGELFDRIGSSGWPVVGFQVDFVIDRGRVTGVALLEEFPERPPGGRPWAWLHILNLKGEEVRQYPRPTVLEAYRVDTVDSRSYLVLGSLTTSGCTRLVAIHVGLENSEIARGASCLALSRDTLGRKATHQLEDVEAVVSKFETATKNEHAVRMFKSDFIGLHVKELKRREGLKTIDSSGGTASGP